MNSESTHAISVCVLAGGLSTRMGRDKARLRLGGRTLLARVRATASSLALPVRVFRCDTVARCGPLGGIYTALTTDGAEAVLFLACDMPFVSAAWLEKLLAQFARHRRATFTLAAGRAGFPLLVRRADLAVVEAQIARREFSLQKLAAALNARLIRPPRSRAEEFFNVNTPAEWALARRRARAYFPAARAKFTESR